MDPSVGSGHLLALALTVVSLAVLVPLVRLRPGRWVTPASWLLALLLVANEVGFGIVPDTAMGRRFRDAQGWLNQRLAAACDHVVLVAAGLPLILKPRPRPDIPL